MARDAWLGLVVLVGCTGSAVIDGIGDDDSDGSDDDSGDDDAVGDDDAGDDDAGDDDAGDDDAGDDDAGDDDSTPAVVYAGRCGDARPDGAPAPAPPPTYTGGACPGLLPGRNTLVSGGIERELLLIVPSDFDPVTEQLPLMVLWHFLGGSANSMVSHGDLQAAVDAQRFIAAVPEKTGDLGIGWGDYVFDPAWPYLTVNTAAQMDRDLVLFDDMLACVAEQYGVDLDCVSSLGVSAGALWTDQLVQRRADRLASAISLSGGIGPATGVGFFDVQGWQGAARPVPTLVLWGGSTDYLGVDFQVASLNLEAELDAGGHFVAECVHNCGHAVPPVDPADGLSVLYRFAFDHPFWQTPGTSVWVEQGLPVGTPEWCAVGSGSATPRTGSCDAEGDLGN